MIQEGIRVVVHYKDGTIIKGTTADFFPSRPVFHIVKPGGGGVTEVLCKELKAVFFVGSLSGDPRKSDPQGFLSAPGENARGKKIAVLFHDGELICGYTMTYSTGREGFFMFPADISSNNQRIYVMANATEEVAAGPAADTLVRKVLGKVRAR